jgi:hypothetical protein
MGRLFLPILFNKGLRVTLTWLPRGAYQVGLCLFCFPLLLPSFFACSMYNAHVLTSLFYHKAPHYVWMQADYRAYAKGSVTETRRLHTQVNAGVGAAFAQTLPLAHSWGAPGFIAGYAVKMQMRDKRDSWWHNGGDYVWLDGVRVRGGRADDEDDDEDGNADDDVVDGDAAVIRGVGGEEQFGAFPGRSNAWMGTNMGCPVSLPGKFTTTGSKIEQSGGFWCYRFFDVDALTYRRSFIFEMGAFRNHHKSVVYYYQASAPPQSPLRRSLQPVVQYDAAGAPVAAAADVIYTRDATYSGGGDGGSSGGGGGGDNAWGGQQRAWTLCGAFCAGAMPEREPIDIDYAALHARFQTREDPEKIYPQALTVRLSGPSGVTQPPSGALTEKTFRCIENVHARQNFVDIGSYFTPEQPRSNARFLVGVSAYAETTIRVETDGVYAFVVGSDDDFTVSIDGQRRFHRGARLRFETTRLPPVTLAAGEHRVLLKLLNLENMNFRAFVFLFRLVRVASSSSLADHDHAVDAVQLDDDVTTHSFRDDL